MSEKIEQRPRVSYTMSYKGIVVGGFSQYHPEKMDVTVSMTVDHIDGETEDEIKKRIELLKPTKDVLVSVVGNSVVEQVNQIKKRFEKDVNNIIK